MHSGEFHDQGLRVRAPGSPSWAKIFRQSRWGAEQGGTQSASIYIQYSLCVVVWFGWKPQPPPPEGARGGAKFAVTIGTCVHLTDL